MKIKLLLLSLFLILNQSVKAQYVVIPDANFAAWLQTNYPQAMSGNALNTQAWSVQSAIGLTLQNLEIENLWGVQFFSNLLTLACFNNNLTSLPPLPATLTELYCGSNNFISLSDLPSGLIELSCYDNQLTSLPSLPASLEVLNCAQNPLVSLPSVLPSTLSELSCQYTQLTTIPDLPQSLRILNCSHNQLSSLPFLPNLTSLDCSYNQISCFPTFPETLIYDFQFTILQNPFVCLPNYVTAMVPVELAYPLCEEDNPVTNPNGCSLGTSISGSIFNDANDNCNLDSGEISLQNLMVKLYDTNNNLIKQTLTAADGSYQFHVSIGNYSVKLDTIGMPFIMVCSNPGNVISVNATASPLTNINFPVKCKPGFDIGVGSILTNGIIFPGQNHELKIQAGNLSQWVDMNCLNSISGEVQISVSGPVTYLGAMSNTLLPIVNGNVFTYQIFDFDLLDFINDFGLRFKTNISAQSGEQICVTVLVTPESGDYNLSNNTFTYCYSVVNSYDPNMKEVYPLNVEPGYDDYFTYTIHFQNTGTAAAINIRLTDTISSNLDLETFQITNYSHFNTAKIINNVLTFNFPNIQLADSTSDPEGSKGYVQYRIKPKANLPLCTRIENTANIYFDFNEPIRTNTTVNEFNTKISLGTVADPNPCLNDGSIQITGSGTGTLSWTGADSGSINNFILGDIVANLVAGAYEFTFNNSCNSNTLEAVLIGSVVPETPTITASDVTTFCEGDNVTLTSSSLVDNVWSTGETTQEITVYAAGNYSVSVNNGTCTSIPSLDELITVNVLPQTPTITANGSTTFCEGNNVILTSSSLVDNVWSTGEITQEITIYAAGNYSVSVNNGTCTSIPSLDELITVNVLPQTPTITASDVTTFCEGDNVILTSSSLVDNVWSTGETTQTITVDATGNYSVLVNNGLCSSLIENITVTENTNPIITIATLEDICNTSGSFTLTNGSPAGGNYLVNGVSESSFNPSTANIGVNSIIYTFSDGNGCSSEATSSVNVLNCLETDELNSLIIEIYPNPTNGLIYLKGENVNLIASIYLRDALGRLISTYSDSPSVIDLNSFVNGIYTMLIRMENSEQILKINLIK
ncbi:MAG: leucine-rich repeat domain-containing protein [Bacteroidota bacterium]